MPAKLLEVVSDQRKAKLKTGDDITPELVVVWSPKTGIRLGIPEDTQRLPEILGAGVESHLPENALKAKTGRTSPSPGVQRVFSASHGSPSKLPLAPDKLLHGMVVDRSCHKQAQPLLPLARGWSPMPCAGVQAI